jgi:hypothetical protein
MSFPGAERVATGAGRVATGLGGVATGAGGANADTETGNPHRAGGRGMRNGRSARGGSSWHKEEGVS